MMTNKTYARHNATAQKYNWRSFGEMMTAASNGVVALPIKPADYNPPRYGRPNKRSAAARLRAATKRLNVDMSKDDTA